VLFLNYTSQHASVRCPARSLTPLGAAAHNPSRRSGVHTHSKTAIVDTLAKNKIQMSTLKNNVAVLYEFKSLIHKIQDAENMVVARAGEMAWIVEMRERAYWITLAEAVVTRVLKRVAGPPSLLELGITKVAEMKAPLAELPKTLRRQVQEWPVYTAVRDLKRRAKVDKAVTELNRINKMWTIAGYEVEVWGMEQYLGIFGQGALHSVHLGHEVF
jgi:hypothetical protein